MWEYIYTDELYHHGIKGQKWGVRRYQNEDGTLTSAGKRRINRSEEVRDAKKAHKERQKNINNEYARARAVYETSGPLIKRKNAAYDSMVKTGDKYRAETKQYKRELADARTKAAERLQNESVNNSSSKKSNLKILADGAIGVIGAKAVFALAGGVATLAGKKYTANMLNRMGDFAMIGGGIATTAKLISNN